MPYSKENRNALPSNVRELSTSLQDQWIAVWNSVYEESGDEAQAFRTANGVVKKAQGKMWVEDNEWPGLHVDRESGYFIRPATDKEVRKRLLMTGWWYGRIDLGYSTSGQRLSGPWRTKEDILKWMESNLSVLAGGEAEEYEPEIDEPETFDDEEKDFSLSQGSTGGYLVPEDRKEELLQRKSSDYATSAMIGFHLEGDPFLGLLRSQYPVEEQETPQHITLVHLGEIENLLGKEFYQQKLEEFCLSHGWVDGYLCNTSTPFEPQDGSPMAIVSEWEGDQITPYYDDMLRNLEGAYEEQTHPNYSPHMTLAYSFNSYEPLTFKYPLRLMSISLFWGNDLFTYYLLPPKAAEKGLKTAWMIDKDGYEHQGDEGHVAMINDNPYPYGVNKDWTWDEVMNKGNIRILEYGTEIDAESRSIDNYTLGRIQDFVRTNISASYEKFSWGAWEDSRQLRVPYAAFQSAENVDQLLYENEVKGVAEFTLGIRGPMRALWNGDINKFEFWQKMASVLQAQYLSAWSWGLRGTPGYTSEAGLSELQNQTEESISHVRELADWIEENSRSNGGKLADIFARAELWINDYRRIREASALFENEQDDKALFRWDWNPNKEHCTDCETYNGQIHTAKEWKELGVYPKGRMLECGGWHCGCHFTPVNAEGKAIEIKSMPPMFPEYWIDPRGFSLDRDINIFEYVLGEVMGFMVTDQEGEIIEQGGMNAYRILLDKGFIRIIDTSGELIIDSQFLNDPNIEKIKVALRKFSIPVSARKKFTWYSEEGIFDGPSKSLLWAEEKDDIMQTYKTVMLEGSSFEEENKFYLNPNIRNFLETDGAISWMITETPNPALIYSKVYEEVIAAFPELADEEQGSLPIPELWDAVKRMVDEQWSRTSTGSRPMAPGYGLPSENDRIQVNMEREVNSRDYGDVFAHPYAGLAAVEIDEELKYAPIGPISQSLFDQNNYPMIEWYNWMAGQVAMYVSPAIGAEDLVQWTIGEMSKQESVGSDVENLLRSLATELIAARDLPLQQALDKTTDEWGNIITKPRYLSDSQRLQVNESFGNAYALPDQYMGSGSWVDEMGLTSEGLNIGLDIINVLITALHDAYDVKYGAWRNKWPETQSEDDQLDLMSIAQRTLQTQGYIPTTQDIIEMYHILANPSGYKSIKFSDNNPLDAILERWELSQQNWLQGLYILRNHPEWESKDAMMRSWAEDCLSKMSAVVEQYASMEGDLKLSPLKKYEDLAQELRGILRGESMQVIELLIEGAEHLYPDQDAIRNFAYQAFEAPVNSGRLDQAVTSIVDYFGTQNEDIPSPISRWSRSI